MLTKHRLWHYQLLPAFVSLIITSLMVALMLWCANLLRGWVDQRWEFQHEGLDDFLALAVGAGAFVFMVLIFLFLHKHIVLVALSPFLGRIA